MPGPKSHATTDSADVMNVGLLNLMSAIQELFNGDIVADMHPALAAVSTPFPRRPRMAP